MSVVSTAFIRATCFAGALLVLGVTGDASAQAVPGPLFTFAAYLGAALTQPPNGWLGALLCLISIFAPSFLLVIGVLPFWETLRRHVRVRRALLGVNAAVVGLLLAALYDPVITSAVHAPGDAALALAAFLLLSVWRLPPWSVVGLSALGGWALEAVGTLP